jgi:uncharacterized protein (DUF1800 family)
MKKQPKAPFPSLICLAVIILLSAFYQGGAPTKAANFRMPYKSAGLTKQQAAAHLLSRFTFGATPDQVDEVVKTGLENWLTQQLDASLPDDSLYQKLASYDILNMSNATITQEFPHEYQLVNMAVKQGLISKDSVSFGNKDAYRSIVQSFALSKGYRPDKEIAKQLFGQKILRAVYSRNQLQEVLTDFWFNHFNVYFPKGDCQFYTMNYENKVIRPNALGKFHDLLLATAQSPAMLFYLDNASSVGVNTPFAQRVAQRIQNRTQQINNTITDSAAKAQALARLQKVKNNTQGLNENYAREIMELHTLGVDGGYTQQDVTQAARILTGWTIFPMNGDSNNAIIKLYYKLGEDSCKKLGYVHRGDFFFNINKHDNNEKTVLQTSFPEQGGYNEGEQFISMLAQHPSTAKFICRKLAVHFVSDNPPQSLINKMAAVFLKTDGDIKQVIIAMVSAPEFWDQNAVRQKIKSPFELAVSTVRSLQANVTDPLKLNNWITRMGQQLYYYQPPTGFPDKGQYWINSGSLLNRMNFGLAFAAQNNTGCNLDLLAINNHHEPESAEAALFTYAQLMMPQRSIDEPMKKLVPLINNPDFAQKVVAKSGNNNTETGMNQKQNINTANTMGMPLSNNALAQVVGIIIGSPEFQRK